MKIICCENEIKEVEEGVNNSDYYECNICGKGYNIIESKLELN